MQLARRCLFSAPAKWTKSAFHTSCVVQHENPLVSSTAACWDRLTFSKGLPRSGAAPTLPRRGPPPKRSIPNVKKVIIVASGKGGVGKSTIAGVLLGFSR